jgi:hypothetical protein
MGVQLSKRDALSRYERREVDADDPEDQPLTAPVTPAIPSPIGLPNERASTIQALSQARSTRLRTASRAALAQALAADMQPLRERIAAALQAPDADLAASLANCASDLPALSATPASQKAFEDSLTAALFNGFAESKASHQSHPSQPKATP